MMETWFTLAAGLFIGYILLVLYRKIATRWCHSDVDLCGKTALITGANSGIGYYTALDLARRNARVILACRSEEKGRKAVQCIQEKTGNSQVVFLHLDLCSLKSVRQCAREVLHQEKRLDLLVNNAGVVGGPSKLTEDGLNHVMAANHFGHFLLTNLLLDLLKKSSPSRIVVLSSVAHVFGTIDLTKLNSVHLNEAGLGYARSKLANVLFTRELSRRLEATGVTANAVHPGGTSTELWKSLWLPIRIPLAAIARAFFHSAEAGAQTSIYCAVSQEVAGVSGRYFEDCHISRESRRAQDDVLARKLWDVSERLVGLS